MIDIWKVFFHLDQVMADLDREIVKIQRSEFHILICSLYTASLIWQIPVEYKRLGTRRLYSTPLLIFHT